MVAKNLTRNTCVLVYHGISCLGRHGTVKADVFERQVNFLRVRFRFVNLKEFLAGDRSAKKKILLTFDDGYHNNYEYAVPVLRRLNIPAVFFVNNRHSDDPKHFLWFSYLKALNEYFTEPGIKLRGIYFDFSPQHKMESHRKLRNFLLNLDPHPSELYKVLENELPSLESFVPEGLIPEYFVGLAKDEIEKMANDPLFEIGIHTADHPFLPKCTQEEIHSQITRNTIFIQDIAHSMPQSIAYPAGEYNSEVIEICRALQIPFGFALQPQNRRFNFFEIPRLGVYSSSLLKLLIKVVFSNPIRNFHIPVG